MEEEEIEEIYLEKQKELNKSEDLKNNNNPKLKRKKKEKDVDKSKSKETSPKVEKKKFAKQTESENLNYFNPSFLQGHTPPQLMPPFYCLYGYPQSAPYFGGASYSPSPAGYLWPPTPNPWQKNLWNSLSEEVEKDKNKNRKSEKCSDKDEAKQKKQHNFPFHPSSTFPPFSPLQLYSGGNSSERIMNNFYSPTATPTMPLFNPGYFYSPPPYYFQNASAAMFFNQNNLKLKEKENDEEKEEEEEENDLEKEKNEETKEIKLKGQKKIEENEDEIKMIGEKRGRKINNENKLFASFMEEFGESRIEAFDENDGRYIFANPKVNNDDKNENNTKSDTNTCLICGDVAGRHYGVISCEGCKGFFRRTVTLGIDLKDNFKCSTGLGKCKLTKETRNNCPFCRFNSCVRIGMDRIALLRRVKNVDKADLGYNRHNKSDRNRTKEHVSIELVNKICISFKNNFLHRRNTSINNLEEFKNYLFLFFTQSIATIKNNSENEEANLKNNEIEKSEEKTRFLIETNLDSFLVIRHVFLDDLPLLKQFCCIDEINNDEENILAKLMKKVDKFRKGLSADVLQYEEHALVSALGFCFLLDSASDVNGRILRSTEKKFATSKLDKINYNQLRDCLHTQMSIRDPTKFNYKGYNALCRNLINLFETID